MRVSLGLLVIVLAVLAMGALVTADAPEENYEWVPSREMVDYDVDTYPDEILKDWKTGETYVLSVKYEKEGDPYKSPECFVLSRYDEESMSFEFVREVPYTHVYEFAVFDGHLYLLLFYPSSTTFSVAIDDPARSRSVDYTVSDENVQSTYFEIVGINETEMMVLSKIEHRSQNYDSYMRFELVTIDLAAHTTDTDNVMSGITEHGYYTHLRQQGDVLNIFYDDGNYPDFRVYWIQYDLARRENLKHLAYDRIYMEAMYYPWDVIMDPDGSFHLWFPDQGPQLRRYNDEGDHLDTMDLTGLINSPTVPSFGMLPLLCNGSGDLYIVYYNRYSTYIRSMVISRDYSGYSYVNVSNGDFEAHTLRGYLGSNDRIMLVWTEAHGDISELMYTHQVPLTPDLEVDPSTFSFVDDHEHGNEHIGFSLRNVGKAHATSYEVSVTCTSDEGEKIQLIGNGTDDDGLLKGLSEPWRFDTKLAGGSYLVRVTIHSVGPLEIWQENNVFEAYIYIRNKAPELEVYWPHDGMFVEDELRFSGRTSDMEDPDGVFTTISIPGSGYPHYVNGSGYWNVTVNTSEVASGGYGLLMIATDGELSTIVSLMIWVDHPEETLTVAFFDPEGDVDLIAGESHAFQFAASDMFQRRIAYAWTLDGEPVGEDLTSYLLVTRAAGDHVLRAEATNTHHTVAHEWAVSVRDPIRPTVYPVEPTSDITVNKGETVDFAITIENPDLRDYALIWTLDGSDLANGDDLARSVEFATSGDHLVRVTLVAMEGTSSAEWTVTVVNRMPMVLSREPAVEAIRITEATEVTFGAGCEDPDGDELFYSWYSPAMDLGSLSGHRETLNLPCDEAISYKVVLTVSDGEDTVSVEWTVLPEPPVNQAPVLSSLAPLEDRIVIKEDTTIEFLVNVIDPEGGDLSYQWGSSKLTMDGRDEGGYIVDCPCSDEETYTIYVTVSDGEHSVRAEWTVDPRPREEPIDLQNGEIPYVLIAAMIAAACVFAVAYMWWRNNNDEVSDDRSPPKAT